MIIKPTNVILESKPVVAKLEELPLALIVENSLQTKQNKHPVDGEYISQFLVTFSPFGRQCCECCII